MSRPTLFYSPSTASLVVHWLLIELDAPHELRELDFDKGDQKSPEYLKLNPQGRVPALVWDGQVITEAAAILLHLADAHPQAGLAPAAGSIERAHYYQWMFFLANSLQPAYRAWFYDDDSAGPEHYAITREQARRRIEAAWQQVAAHLETHGPYLVGETMTAVDFMATMLMRWSRNMPRPSDDWAVLRDYAARMKALPSFKTVYAREGLTDWA